MYNIYNYMYINIIISIMTVAQNMSYFYMKLKTYLIKKTAKEYLNT